MSQCYGSRMARLAVTLLCDTFSYDKMIYIFAMLDARAALQRLLSTLDQEMLIR